MSKVNPDEAPEGYRAEKTKTSDIDCDGCDIKYDSPICIKSKCWHGDRKDGQDVIFKKVEG